MLRRNFLSTAGVSIALPFLPSLGWANPSPSREQENSISPKRMVCIGNMLGFYPPAFWPKLTPANSTDGLTIHRDFTMGESSASLAGIREDLTIIQLATWNQMLSQQTSQLHQISIADLLERSRAFAEEVPELKIPKDWNPAHKQNGKFGFAPDSPIWHGQLRLRTILC